MNFKHIFISIYFFFFFSVNESLSQNLDVISLKKGVEASGSISVNSIGYKAFGIDQRRDPFSWFLNSNLNLSLFGYSAPLSFSYSNAGGNFSQPFNQFRFAPQYKWIKTYTVNTSMTFSPYTLAGHMFYGGGVDLTPGKWRISAMYGRLRKAVAFNQLDTLPQPNTSFKRIGYGVKVGYETNGDAVSFNVFAAKDDASSLSYIPVNSVITPQQNVAMSIGFRKKLFKRLTLDLEYGVSALNTNTLANVEERDSSFKSQNLLKWFLPSNTTSRYFDALNASVGYQGKTYGVQMKYERIAPEYQTLGAYFFNNDLRNITIAPSVRLFENKVALRANAGIQENNLDKSRTSTSTRLVGAFNIQFIPNDKWNIASNYSNFSSYTNVRPPSDPFFRNGLDTLNFYQVSETMGSSISYSFGSDQIKQNIAINGSYQKASNKAAGTAQAQLSDFINGSISYSCLLPADLTLATSLNINTNSAANIRTTFLGPAVNASKSLMEKIMRISYSTSYSKTIGERITASPVWSNQMAVSYSPKGKNETSRASSNFTFGANLLRRPERTPQAPSFTELTITLNYSYSF
jgi:hypothetical protein